MKKKVERKIAQPMGWMNIMKQQTINFYKLYKQTMNDRVCFEPKICYFLWSNVNRRFSLISHGFTISFLHFLIIFFPSRIFPNSLHNMESISTPLFLFCFETLRRIGENENVAFYNLITKKFVIMFYSGRLGSMPSQQRTLPKYKLRNSINE